MANQIFITLSNPIAAQDDAAFNQWYDTVHSKEVLALDGIVGMTRYRAVAQFLPPAETPDYRYLAVYEVDDLDTAMRSMAEGQPNFTMTDTFDPAGASGVSFEQIFSAKA